MGLNDLLGQAGGFLTNAGNRAGDFVDKVTEKALSKEMLDALKSNVENVKQRTDNLNQYPVYKTIAIELSKINTNNGHNMYQQILSNTELLAMLMSLSDLNTEAAKIGTISNDGMLAIACIHAVVSNIKSLQGNGIGGTKVVIDGSGFKIIDGGNLIGHGGLLDGMAYHMNNDGGYTITDGNNNAPAGASAIAAAANLASGGSTNLADLPQPTA